MSATGTGRRWRTAVAAGLACGAGLLTAGCGAGLDAQPHVINNASVPYGLTRSAPPTTAAGAPTAYVTVYLVGMARLVAVSRPVQAPVTVASITQALSAGPTASEAAEGLESPVSSAAPLTFDHLVNTVATIDVSSSFTTLAQKEQEIAVAQLVYALTAFPGVQSVEIRIGGRSVDVPTGKGTLTRQPLTRKDYASLAPY